MLAAPRELVVFNDPGAMVRASLLGMGVTFAALPDVLPHLERGELVRLCPRWWADAGAISIYYSGGAVLPGRTRAFVDHVAAEFKAKRLPEHFAGSVG
jgi:DNA-binding transcriptional LysR family regulator